jgi:hypothetical protein
MVYTYGVAPEDGAEPRHDNEDGEASALLGANASPTSKKEGHASIVSCVSNLSNTIIGSGECPSLALAPSFARLKHKRFRHADVPIGPSCSIPST